MIRNISRPNWIPVKLLTLLVAFLTLQSVKVAAQCSDWVRVGGFPAGASYDNQPIAVNSSGVPYVVTRESTNKATVKMYTAGSWESVGAAGFSSAQVLGQVLAIDNAGTPYVAFCDSTFGWKLTVMKYNGSSWVVVGAAGFTPAPVFNGTDGTQHFSLAIDAAGTPFVAFHDASNGNKASVMKFTSGSWTAVGSAGFSAGAVSYLSLAVNSTTGDVYVAYSDQEHDAKATVMKYNGAGWSVMGSAGFTAGSVRKPSIALSSTGTVHVAYSLGVSGLYSYAVDGVYVSMFDGSSWNILGSAVMEEEVWLDAVMAFGTGDVPYVLSSPMSYGAPMVKKYNGSSWVQVGSVEPGVSSGPLSFSISGAGKLYYSLVNGYGFAGMVRTFEPISTTIAGPSTVCGGATATLTHAQAGGIWSSAISDIAAVGSATGIVTGGSAGVTNITYTIGQCNATRPVTVNPTAGSISGPLYVNTGSVITLSSTVGGGSWSVSNANASINSSGVLSGVAAGTTTVSYTVTGSCGSASNFVVITVLPSTGTPCRDWNNTGSGIPGGMAVDMNFDVDASGTPYLGFSNYPALEPTLMKFNGTTWNTLGTIGFGPTPAWKFSFVLDNSGTPYAVTQSGAYELNAFRFDGYSWETLAAPPYLGRGPIIKKDAAGDIYVICADAFESRAIMSKYNGSGWDSTGFALPSWTSGVTGMAFHGTTPYAVYMNGDDYKPTVMKYNGTSWETVGSPSFTPGPGYDAKIEIAPDGTPYIIYLDADDLDNGVTVMKYDGSSWVVVGTRGFMNVVGEYAMSIDASGVVYVGGNDGYIEGKGNVMKFDGGEWVNVGTPLFTTPAGYYVALKVAQDGNMYYAYGDAALANTEVMRYSPIGSYSAITGPSSICVGSSVTLSNAGTTGTWSSSAAFVAAVGSGTGIVSGVANGVSNITYAVGICKVTKQVTVGAVAGMISGPLSVATGSTINMTSTVPGGTWSVSNSNASISSTGVVTGISTGTVTVSYTVTNSCGTTTSTVGVEINATGIPCVAWQNVGPTPYAASPAYWSASALDGAGRPYVMYGDPLDGDRAIVKRYDGSNWVTVGEPVTDGAGTGFNITIGPDGMPYVVVWDYPYATAVFTPYIKRFNGSTWETLFTDEPTGSYSYLEIKFDPSGTLYQSYQNSIGRATVKKYVGGSWVNLGGGEVVNGYSSSEPSLAISNTGTLYVAFQDDIMNITVMKYNGTGWEVVGTPSFTGGYASDLDLKINSAGTPYIVFKDYSYASKASVMKFDGSAWVAVGTRGFSAGVVSYQTVEIDDSDNVYVQYSDGGFDGKEVIMKYNGASWEPVWGATVSENPAAATTLAFDPSGVPYISYIESSGDDGAIVVRRYAPGPAVAITGPAALCQGALSTLSSLAFGGSWSSSDVSVAVVGSADGIVGGIDAGTAVITYTVGTCSASTVVTVGALIFVPGISGATSLCEGYTTSMTDIMPGGVWSSSDTTVATIDSFGVITGVNPGSTVIRYTVTSAICGPSAAAVVVTVNSATSLGAISGSGTLCAGSTATLTNATTGGTWSTGNASIATVGSSTGIVTGVAAGNATITYTLTNGCGTSTATTVVTVNSTPFAGTITGSGTVCESATTTLSNAAPGGTWSSSNTSVATVGSATGIVSGVTTGNATITYSVTSGCGTVTATAVVTVNTAPSVGTITGTATVCTGNNTTLNNATLGGTWSSSNTSVATVGSTTGIVSGASAGNTTITYSVASGCGTATATAAVTVNATPTAGTITSAATVCAGNTTTLNNATSGGAWSSGNTSVATVGSATGTVTGVTAGNATITYSVTSGCGTATATAVVTVNATPSAGTITGTATVCAGNATTLNNATSGGTWSSSNAAIATVGAATGIVSGVAAGNTTITYTVSNGCGSATATKVVTVNAATSAGAITGAGSICTGTTATLINAVSGGAWSSSDYAVATVGSSTGIVTGVSSGNATITYNVSGSCGTATATAVVTVGATASITGSIALCAGMTSTLSAGATGGVWSSSNTAVATIGAANGILTAVATGTSNITYTTGGGCTATAVVTVSAPALIAGTSNACVGQNATLTDATPGGVWSSSNTSLATVDASTGVVTGIAAGTATVSYVVSAGCYRTIAFTVKALPPAIAAPVTVCAGSTVYVAPPSTNGYSWTSSNTSVAVIGSSTGMLTGVSAGTTTLTYITNTGCFVTTVATVNTAPAAITGITALCSGTASTLASSTPGGVWSSSNTSVAAIGSATGAFTAGSAGTATISYMVSGCRTTAVVTVSAIAAITGTPSVCAGASATLGNTSAGGTWSSSNTGIATVGTSGILSGVAAGNATITYTLASGCTRTITATVVATPAGITGDLSICPATTTTLSGGTAGGSWSGGNASIATINSSTGVLSGIGAGTINVSYTLTGCRVTAIATVNPLPAVITGTINACIAQTSTLNNATAGGVWTSNNTGIATVDPSTGIVTGVTAATTTITYTLSTGCYRTIPFTVKALPPAITASVAACVGTTTYVAPPSTNGKSWSSSNTAIATIGSTNSIMTGVAPGTTILTYTATTGCYVTMEATVYALPNAGTITGPTSVIVGNTVTLDDAAGGGVWSSGNVARATIGAATGIVTGVAGGTATMSYSVSNPGCTVRATQVISVLTSRPGGSTVSADNSLFRLYPNPTIGAFTIEVEEAGTFSIFSLDGKEIGRHNINTGVNQLTLSSQLASGIYMCRFTGETGNTTMVRLVYER